MTRPRILVVEDESIVALDIKAQLECLGYVVPAVVNSGEKAIHKTAEIRPDLVLMDIKLKGEMDGIEAAEVIRARLDIPVIYLTAYADYATLQRAKITEPYGYLLKPFEERELHSTIEMALYRHEMERKLRESEQWLSTTLKSIGDAVIATDENGFLTFMNPVAEALTGWKQEEALGQDSRKVFRIVNGKTQTPAESPVTKVLQGSVVAGLDDNTLLVARDGTATPIDDSAAPIRDDKGNIRGVVLVFRDITARKRAEERLRQYATELKARNEDLNLFARTVAHDLKDPLGTVIGFADVLEEDCVTMPGEQLQGFLQIIGRVGRKMNNIVDELLLLAGVREVEFEAMPLDMASIVAEASQRLTSVIQEHQAKIKVNNSWPVASGYGPWVEEVWVNYLSNAIKYGGQPPHVELGATAQPDDMIRFWVRDNGSGLTPEEQARLFTPFTRLGQVRATGHGLGLSIVRSIVGKLGGQVGVESRVGQGSVFFFTLPATASQVRDRVGCER